MLVEVHPGVQAARLLERRPVVAAGPQRVQRPRVVGEEPERVEVRAGHPVPLDHLVGAAGTQPQRPRGVPDVGLVEPVDHRPLVQAEAAELRRAGGGGREQRVQRGEQRALSRDVLPRHRGVAAGPLDVPLEAGVRRPAALEHDAVPGVPPAQRRGTLGVVGEQEVLDRVRHPGLAALEVRPHPRLDPCLVGGAALPPRRLVQDRVPGRHRVLHTPEGSKRPGDRAQVGSTRAHREIHHR